MAQNKDSNNWQEKGLKAARAYIENRGLDIVDTNYECPYGVIDVISKDSSSDTLVFTSVEIAKNDNNLLPKEKFNATDRQHMEQLMAHYLQNHDFVDMAVRWDNLGLLILGENKALIRNHVNVLGGENSPSLKVPREREKAPDVDLGKGSKRVNSKSQNNEVKKDKTPIKGKDAVCL